jgi:hypothetical protein
MVRTQTFFCISMCLNYLDDAIDEMISTKIDESLLYEIKRFHSDSDVSAISM